MGDHPGPHTQASNWPLHIPGSCHSCPCCPSPHALPSTPGQRTLYSPRPACAAFPAGQGAAQHVHVHVRQACAPARQLQHQHDCTLLPHHPPTALDHQHAGHAQVPSRATPPVARAGPLAPACPSLAEAAQEPATKSHRSWRRRECHAASLPALPTPASPLQLQAALTQPQPRSRDAAATRLQHPPPSAWKPPRTGYTGPAALPIAAPPSRPRSRGKSCAGRRPCPAPAPAGPGPGPGPALRRRAARRPCARA
jgi:hypothetical protein